KLHMWNTHNNKQMCKISRCAHQQSKSMTSNRINTNVTTRVRTHAVFMPKENVVGILSICCMNLLTRYAALCYRFDLTKPWVILESSMLARTIILLYNEKMAHPAKERCSLKFIMYL